MAKYNSKKEGQNKGKELLTNVQRLMDIINNRRDNVIKHPAGMPEGSQLAANWFIKLLEPRNKFEKVDNNIDPYQERLVDCLKTYYKFSRQDQVYILGLIESGIEWRGDSIEFIRIRQKVDMNKLNKTKLTGMIQTIIRRAGTTPDKSAQSETQQEPYVPEPHEYLAV